MTRALLKLELDWYGEHYRIREVKPVLVEMVRSCRARLLSRRTFTAQGMMLPGILRLVADSGAELHIVWGIERVRVMNIFTAILEMMHKTQQAMINNLKA